MSSEFEGIEQAQVSQKLPNVQPGQYVFEVEALKIVATRTKGKMFIAEFKVVESTGALANAPGTKCSNVIKMSLESALGNIKGIAAAVLDEPEKMITSKTVDGLVSEANPAKGTKVRADASTITTRAGNPFTLLKFSAYSGTSTATAPPARGATTSTAARR